jgi:hypothetical protein
VVATVGSTITLECTLSGSVTVWQKWMTSYWSNKLQDSSKYGNTNTKYLTRFNIDVNDAGTYRCTAGSQQLRISLSVTGMYSRYDKYIPMTTTSGRLITDICVNCSS